MFTVGVIKGMYLSILGLQTTGIITYVRLKEDESCFSPPPPNKFLISWIVLKLSKLRCFFFAQNSGSSTETAVK